MFAELFRNSPLLALPMMALGLFGTLFAAAVALVFSRGASHYDRLAKLPLDMPSEDDDDRSA